MVGRAGGHPGDRIFEGLFQMTSDHFFMKAFSCLSKPFSMPPVHLKNRITMAPLFTAYANPDGTPSDFILAHYREMAASGVAMVVVANASVSTSGALSRYQLRADHDRFIVGLSAVAQTIREGGAVPVPQVNHGGRLARVKRGLAPSVVPVNDIEMIGFLRTLFKSSPFKEQWDLVSEASQNFSEQTKEMDARDILQIIDAYAQAARRAMDAGFDMVGIHGGTGYLPVQFLSPRTNRRRDRYGGNIEKRIRFPLELVEAIKRGTGEGFPVGYRFMLDEWMPDGFSMDEAIVFARELANRNVAYLSLTAGTYASLSVPESANRYKRPGYLAQAGKQIRVAAGLPVIVAGRITTPELAERILREAQALLVEAGVSKERITIQVRKKQEGVARDILKEIDSGGFGTVVLGRRGVSRTEQFLFGSVSSKILQNARNCTVWLVD